MRGGICLSSKAILIIATPLQATVTVSTVTVCRNFSMINCKCYVYNRFILSVKLVKQANYYAQHILTQWQYIVQVTMQNIYSQNKNILCSTLRVKLCSISENLYITRTEASYTPLRHAAVRVYKYTYIYTCVYVVYSAVKHSPVAVAQ
jgi:hypothetical protein